MTLEKQMWMFNFLQRLLEGIRDFTAELFTFKTEFLFVFFKKSKTTWWKNFRKFLITSRAANQTWWLGIIIFMRKKGSEQQLLPNLLNVLLEVTWSWRSKCCQLGRNRKYWICHRILAKESVVTCLSQSKNFFFGTKPESQLKSEKSVTIFHTSIQKCRTSKSHLMLTVSCGKIKCSLGWCQL